VDGEALKAPLLASQRFETAVEAAFAKKLLEVGGGRLACAALKLDASKARQIRMQAKTEDTFILLTLCGLLPVMDW
jgi:hypothetical protein